MVKLYGMRMSNYYSLTKAVLIEKGIDFEEVKQMPVQEEHFLEKSPMGKMPAIEIDGTYLSESLAIAQWAESVQPEPALLPSDPLAAAKVMELVCHLKLDVELVARRCLGELLFKQPVSEEVKDYTRTDLAKGMKAVDRLFVGNPYAAGDTFTLADLYTFYTFGLASMVASQTLGMDILADQPKIADVIARVAERPSVAKVEADKAA